LTAISASYLVGCRGFSVGACGSADASWAFSVDVCGNADVSCASDGLRAFTPSRRHQRRGSMGQTLGIQVCAVDIIDSAIAQHRESELCA